MIEDRFVDEDDEPDPALNRITNEIIGAAIAVHRALGPGHLESAYEEALAIEFDYRGIPYQRQLPIILTYRGKIVGEGRLDFLIREKVVLELKAVESISPAFDARIISYLKITKHKLGLIINFNVAVLKNGIKRYAN